MKKFISQILVCICAAGFFYSCDDDDDDPIWYFWDEPAFVRYSNDRPMLENAYGRFYAPTLNDTVSEGSYLLTNFVVDYGNQPRSSDTLTVSGLRYSTLGKSEVIISGGDMKDDYTALISSAVLYPRSIINNVWFFEFAQVGSRNNSYDYEIICNTDSAQQYNDKTIQTLYIRSKNNDQSSGSSTFKVFYGFDMNEFVEKYKDDKTVTFNIKYKTGTDSDGNDIYKPFLKNPITLPVR